MLKNTLLMSTLAATLFLSNGLAVAAESQQVYGSPLMTQQEMFEFHNRMRNARTPQESEQIRNQHHQLMQSRAKAQGFSIPDIPPTNDACRNMAPGCMGPGYMGPRHMGPGYMGPGYMGPGHMSPGYMGPGYMGPGGYRNP